MRATFRVFARTGRIAPLTVSTTVVRELAHYLGGMTAQWAIAAHANACRVIVAARAGASA